MNYFVSSFKQCWGVERVTSVDRRNAETVQDSSLTACRFQTFFRHETFWSGWDRAHFSRRISLVSFCRLQMAASLLITAIIVCLRDLVTQEDNSTRTTLVLLCSSVSHRLVVSLMGKNDAKTSQSRRSFTNTMPTHLGFVAPDRNRQALIRLYQLCVFIFCTFFSPFCGRAWERSAQVEHQRATQHWECGSKWPLFPLLSPPAPPGREPPRIIKNIILVIYCKLFPRFFFSFLLTALIDIFDVFEVIFFFLLSMRKLHVHI